MDKRYQVFISSTFEDLKEERQAVLKAILELNHMPAGMELFPASDETAWRLICDVIDASDYYVLIVGGRYGSLDAKGISYTEREYDYAIDKGKPVTAILHADPNNLPRGKTETDRAAWTKLEAFTAKVKARHTCVSWSNAHDLKAQVIISLTAAIKKHDAVGWIRADQVASDEAARQLLAAHSTIEKLKGELEFARVSPPEGTDSLSSGSDLVEVAFKVTFGKHGYDRYPYREDPSARLQPRRFKAQVAWDTLFGGFATDFLGPGPDSRMKTGIARVLRETFIDALLEHAPGYVVRSTTISETLFQMLRLQFAALGLIQVRTEVRQVKDREQDTVMIELTPYGHAHLLKVRAIFRDGHHALSGTLTPLPGEAIEEEATSQAKAEVEQAKTKRAPKRKLN